MTTKHERPFLYVLATQPSTPNQASTSEWIIELFKPPPTGLKPLSTVSQSKNIPSSSTATSSTSQQHHFLPTLGSPHQARHQHEQATGTISPTAPPSEASTLTSIAPPVQVSQSIETASISAPASAQIQPSKPERIFFSRLHQGPSSSYPDSSFNVILRISVTSVPYQHSHQITSDLNTECTSALETVHTTPDSSSWLRQALLALQGKGILPPVSHDFDVTKFMSVADQCLSKTLETSQRRGDTLLREVRYWRLLRGLDDRDDGVDEAGLDGEDGDGEGAGGFGGGDLTIDGQARDWSLPHRERKSIAEKGAGSVGGGGFWISHGPLAERTKVGAGTASGDRKPWERGNTYGGLM